MASHEIRSPLSAIIGFVELLDGKLKPGQIDDECWNYISIIKRNAQLLLTVINDLLDFSKIEAGKLSTERVDMTLSEMLQDLEETLGLRARGKNIALNIVTDSDVPYVIRSDPTRLRQILLNIIGNSIKFTQHGSVDVNVQLTDDQMLMFTVADTGLGMSPEDAQNIFEPYSQGSTSVTRKFGGTGLGLSISKELARALGGDIVLTQSTPGKGSTFTITIDPGESTKGPDLVSRIDKSGTPTGLQESGLQH